MIRVGAYVSRNSYGNDILFKVVSSNNGDYILKGVNYRLIADSNEDDLKEEESNLENNSEYLNIIRDNIPKNNDDYFFIPGRVLHIDGDEDYLKRCMDYYKSSLVQATGKCIKEKDIQYYVVDLLNEYKPDILVITGHDAYYKKRIGNTSLYKNSDNFALAVRKAREYEKNQSNLIIIAGACQSNYEILIKAGSTYASSPKRINIHALDPAIIAVVISFWNKNKDTDIISILSKTKYGKDGMGGLISKGTMFTGYPREQNK